MCRWSRRSKAADLSCTRPRRPGLHLLIQREERLAVGKGRPAAVARKQPPDPADAPVPGRIHFETDRSPSRPVALRQMHPYGGAFTLKRSEDQIPQLDLRHVAGDDGDASPSPSSFCRRSPTQSERRAHPITALQSDPADVLVVGGAIPSRGDSLQCLSPRPAFSVGCSGSIFSTGGTLTLFHPRRDSITALRHKLCR